MRRLVPLIILILLASWAASIIEAQTQNPIPEPIVTRGLTVQIRDVARLPDTRGLRLQFERSGTGTALATGFARVSYVRDLPDGRRFANDSRGFLYVLDRDNRPSLYADVHAAFPLTSYGMVQSGFMGFAFHPEFARNGLFYTTHGEDAKTNPAVPHFIPPGISKADVTFHTVITEWRATNPAANVFEGSRRELLRVAHVSSPYAHPISHLDFNPTSQPGDGDYGLLYTSGGDYGMHYRFHTDNPPQTQRTDTLVTTILRIDPRSPSESGGTKGVGDYTIPPINTFAADNDPKTFGEIYAYGFGNAHKLAWDPADGTMFALDIGNSNIEEINIVHEGGNYGWLRREGPFDNALAVAKAAADSRNEQSIPDRSAIGRVVTLPEDILNGQTRDRFAYPVAMYDHDEGVSITGGVAYHGRIPALRGKFVFGDIARGRLFAADLAALKTADDGIPSTVAPIEEIQLYVRDAGGNRTPVTLRQLAEKAMGAPVIRADLQISRSRDGEIFITSRQDGMIRMLVPDSD